MTAMVTQLSPTTAPASTPTRARTRVAGGIALVLDADSVAEVAGRAWPFALAFVLTAASAVATVGLFRRHAFTAASWTTSSAAVRSCSMP